MIRLVVLVCVFWPVLAAAQGVPSTTQIRAYYDAEYATRAPLPPLALSAFMIAEDRNFFNHALTNSTITRWIARGLLRPGMPRPTHFVTTGVVAKALTHDEVLNQYAQGVYLGLGCKGARDAAIAYFGHPIETLSLPQIAFLAVLPKSPGAFHPEQHGDRALARRNWLLWEMARNQAITQAQARQATRQPLETQVPLGRCDG